MPALAVSSCLPRSTRRPQFAPHAFVAQHTDTASALRRHTVSFPPHTRRWNCGRVAWQAGLYHALFIGFNVMSGAAHSGGLRTSLIPPFRFSIVEHGVMRGAHPTLKNYRFMRRLGFRTIISLMGDAPGRDILGFCEAEGIELIHHRVEKYDAGNPLAITPRLVSSVIEILINPARHPVYLTCRDGGHNTGLIIMSLRRLEHWTNVAIHEEHRRYTKGHEIHDQEVHFVEAFSGPVTLPPTLPVWLWGGTAIANHPSVQLRHPHASAALGQPNNATASNGEDTTNSPATPRHLSDSWYRNTGVEARNEPSAVDGSWYQHLLPRTSSITSTETRQEASHTAPYSLDLAGLAIAGLDLAPRRSSRPKIA